MRENFSGLGIADEEFIRGDVPMTKEEIRILTLVKARIRPSDIVFDIGAGTGSMSIEAARLAFEGHVYAVERNPEGISLIRQNAEKFQVKNITAIEREAPDGLAELPACDAVIIGGSGRHLEPVLDELDHHLKPGGRIVLNCITVQTLADSLAYMRAHKAAYCYEAVQVQVTQLKSVGPYDMAKALNPIHIVVCEKKMG